MNEPIADLLQTYCADAFPGWQEVRISRFAQLAAGWESVIYGFDLVYLLDGESHREEMALRMYAGDGAWDKAGREFATISRLGQVGYPVPRVFLLERQRSPFGQPFILMERIEGKSLGEVLFNASPPEQDLLLARFCELVARLHKLDWRLFLKEESGSCADGSAPVQPPSLDAWLSSVRATLQHFGWPLDSPFLRWLEQQRPGVARPWPAPVHGDFHPNNVLLRPDGALIVIDWTNFSVTDARFDLAWTLVLTNAYLGMAWRDRMLHEYERQAGQRAEQIEYFEVCACARRLFDLTISLSAGAEKMGMRAGAMQEMLVQAAPARRVYQMLLDYTGVRVEPFEQLLESLG
jgi:aminoglycoside phosphotransferase (APT) family kinase protein